MQIQQCSQYYLAHFQFVYKRSSVLEELYGLIVEHENALNDLYSVLNANVINQVHNFKSIHNLSS